MISDPDDEARIEPRTTLFVMATISGAGGSGPVKVRNLSSSGALVEGPVLPVKSEQVTLRRGGLDVAGEVVWSKGGQAGLKFNSMVNVADWMPRAHAAQQRVDELVAGAKSGQRTSFSSSDPLRAASLTASKLLDAAGAIEDLGEALADDAAVVEKHGSKLQALDIAIQILRRLAAR